MFSYPSDEVGNHFIDYDLLDEKGVNPWTDILTELIYGKIWKSNSRITGVNYIEYYSQLIREQGAEVEVILLIILLLS